MTQNEFFWAIFLGDVSKVRQALKEGVTPELQTREATEALFFAIEAGHQPIMNSLIEGGANPFARDRLGRTAVHAAAFWNRVSMMNALEGLGLAIHEPAQDELRGTPLHHAAQAGALEAVIWLLKKGGDPRARLSTGVTPADLARSHGHGHVATTLEKLSG